ncbi:ATP-binding protein [Yinghuangia sp. YIM S09857]|uniref:ATP-binding protein n=1 Tax=Yinghuangia sp. YIM S09857 TaxID=3436929 RepID=UPI003F531250
MSQARRFVALHCARWDVDANVADDARVITTELASNAHEHSGSPDFTVLMVVAAALHGTVVHIEVTDRGRWPEAFVVPAPDGLCERGRGWRVVEGYAAACGVAHTRDRGTRAWAQVRVHLPRRGAPRLPLPADGG